MAVGDVIRLVLKGFGPQAEEMINTLFYRQTSGIIDLAASTALLWTSQWIFDHLTDYLNCIGTDYTFDSVTLHGLNGGIATLAVDDFSATGAPGSGSGVSGSFERSAVIRKRTGTGGRHGHGRLFLPMTPNGNFFTDGLINPAGPDLGAFGTFASEMLLPVTSILFDSWAPVLVDRNTISTLFLTSTDVAPLVGVQRRRRFGIGA